VAFSVAIAAGLYLVYRGGWPILAMGLLSILSGIFYTAGPYPLGYVGLGDLFVLVFFGPVAVAGTYYVQALSLDPHTILAGLAPGFFSVAILAVNNLRDIENDARCGKRTLAVRFGKHFARMEYGVSILVACLIPVGLFLHSGNHPWSLLVLAVPVAGLGAMKTVFSTPGGPVLNEVLATTGKLLLLFSILFSLGWLF
jgi:1,4-dihydroxy-2-naphthoate octaprenyltransferase